MFALSADWRSLFLRRAPAEEKSVLLGALGVLAVRFLLTVKKVLQGRFGAIS
jgi:hypothetical protein